jgi:membrane-associated phospholipid phosphatase
MAQKDTESKAFKYISKLDCIILGAIALIVLIIGLILIAAGYNEAFYVSDPTIRSIFSILTSIGSEMAYVVLLSIVLFAIDWKMGRGLIVQFMISLFANSFLKDFYKDPRPDTNIIEGEPIEEGYGFPSGHSQNGMAFWGHLLLWKKNTAQPSPINKVVIIIAAIFMIILPISRIIIGVHDLQDIVGGTVIGLVILMVFLFIYPYFEPLKAKPLFLQMILGVTLVLTAWVIVLFAVPEATEGIGQPAGLLIAAAIGFPLEEKYIGYEPAKLTPKQRLLGGLIGVLITFVFYFGLGAVFGLLPEALNWIWRFIRYIFLGLILILLAPWLIKKILKISS